MAVPRFRERYEKEVVPRLLKDLGRTNRLSAPRIQKIVLNMGVGKAVQDKKHIDEAATHLGVVAGQKPIVTKARKSISGFKIRAGMPIGVKVTLRGTRMYEFLDHLISIAIPRIRDFRGLPPEAMDGRGNYTLGIPEVTVFPEVDLDSVTFPQGLDVTIVTTARTNAEGRKLLELFGMPFRASAAEGAPAPAAQR